MAKEKEEDPQIRYEQMKQLFISVESGDATKEQREILRQWAEKSITSSLVYEDSDDDAGSDGNISDEDLSGKEGKAKEGKASESSSSSTSSYVTSLLVGTSSEGTSSSSISNIVSIPDSGASSELSGDSAETGEHLPG